MSMSKEEVVPYENTEYQKSNLLISGKFKSSIIENKIMAISLSHIQNLEEDNKTGILYSKIKASELRNLLGANAGSFYTQLNSVAEAMTGKTIGMSNPEKQVFDYLAVIIRAHYEDGIFTIEYNPHIKNYICNITQNFTLLQLPIMLSFKSVYSFRLYELLKSKAYYPKGVNKTDNIFKIPFSLSELKLDLGIVNADLASVKKALNNSKTPDFDRAVEISPEKMLDKWFDFKRKVLDIAKKEINEKTDMTINYTTLKNGVGAKVYQVNFTVQLNKNKNIQKIEMTTEEQDAFLDSVSELIEEPIKIKDIRSIAEASKYNMEKIKKAYQVMQKSEHVDNIVGFMIKAIQDNYSVPVSKKKNQFLEFEQTEINFEELEKDILANG